ncbi:hypothetical protein [uncultured Phenylobacterium sp.]|uniref:hypothetical protein n=1 Tax=uncultured Phenylobacterium sp. TaxID=349273 RepID=UPI0025FEF978|nr:hypothetical protein [uncultured Phenylobacterium sp.]
MSRFSPSEAAMAGFRLTRAWPGVMFAWSFVYFGGLLLITLTMMATLGPQFIALAQKGGLAPDDMEAVSALLYQSGPGFIVVLLMTVMLVSVLTAGVMRLVLRPAEHGFAHLKLGKDELRLAAVNLAFVGFYVISVVAGLMVRTAFASSGPGLAFLVATLVVGVPTAWLGVRLCLLTPLTFDTRRISFREGFALSRGLGWPLFGMIALAVIFYVMVWIVFFIVSLVLVELSGGQRAMQDIAALTPLTAVATIISIVMQFLLQILQIVMIYGPFAVAYREIRDGAAAPPPGPQRNLFP